MNGKRIDNTAVSWTVNFVLYTFLVFGCGVGFGIHFRVNQELQKSETIVRQVKPRLDEMRALVDEYVSDREIVIEAFKEIEARLTRHEHLMRIPRSERREKWRELEAEGTQ
jgi:hypothetical protein